MNVRTDMNAMCQRTVAMIHDEWIHASCSSGNSPRTLDRMPTAEEGALG